MHTKQCSITVYTAVACNSCPSHDIMNLLTLPQIISQFLVFRALRFLVVSINNEHIMCISCACHVHIMYISCTCHVHIMCISCVYCACHVHRYWWLTCEVHYYAMYWGVSPTTAKCMHVTSNRHHMSLSCQSEYSRFYPQLRILLVRCVYPTNSIA